MGSGSCSGGRGESELHQNVSHIHCPSAGACRQLVPTSAFQCWMEENEWVRDETERTKGIERENDRKRKRI